jgi:hypothetical protein
MNTNTQIPFKQTRKSLTINLSGVKQDSVDTILRLDLAVPLPRTATTKPSPAWPKPVVKSGNLAYRKPAKLLSLDGKRVLHPSTEILYASKAVDGYPGTCAQGAWEWAWALHVDLEKVQTVGRVVVQFGDEKGCHPTEYKINLSVDGENWETVAHVTDFKGGKSEHTFAPTQARYVRVLGIKPDGPNQPGGQMAVYELEVYK